MLEPGTRLGPYEITSALGAGGMGEVYRAKDTRIDRTVAIKVVATDMAGDSGLKERFEREARAVSSLNHPHICTLYEFDSQGGIDFLVMEHLEGETLAKRLERGPIPQDDALRVGIQIADALDKAHRRGIVHRDLKPGNIMLTPSGAKLLDFGLAKLNTPSGNVDLSGLSALPTQGQPLTREGAILGTFQYMAPEQLEGREADARTDIFAFGDILYEMLTGKKAFEGNSQAGLIGAILERQPAPISSLRPATPPSLERLISKCLKKDPDERWGTARDLMDELRWIGEGRSESHARTRKGGLPTWAVAAAALVLGAALTGAVSWVLRPTPVSVPRVVARFPLVLPPEQQMAFNPLVTQLAISPDGRRVAYVTNQGLYLKEMNEVTARLLVEDERTIQSPAFSPDNQWVAFWSSDQKIKKISVLGGAPVVLGESESLECISWVTDDVIHLTYWSKGIWRIQASGGTPEPVVTLAEGERSSGPANLLPDGKSILFSVREGGKWKVAAQSVEDETRQVLAVGGINSLYSPSGHLLFSTLTADLMATAFDPFRLDDPREPAVLVAQGIDPFNFALSKNGTLLSMPAMTAGSATPVGVGRLVWVDRNGGVTQAIDEENVFSRPRLSPDGRRVAVEIFSSTSSKDIWIYDLERGTRTRLTTSDATDQDPLWTPDGSTIVFASNRSGRSNLYQKAVDGSGEAEPFPTIEFNTEASSFSPDGKVLAFYQRAVGSDQNRDIWTMSLDGERKTTPFVATPFNERSPAFSPDGRFIAYASDESGRDEIYVQPYPGPGGRVVVSRGGGREPVWSRDGQELYYRRGNEIWSAPVGLGGTFEVETPQRVFQVRFVPERTVSGSLTYDVHPDGRFIVVQPSEQSSQLQVVLNWFEELNERVPTDR
jgi:Tol biopolymer transport system component